MKKTLIIISSALLCLLVIVSILVAVCPNIVLYFMAKNNFPNLDAMTIKPYVSSHIPLSDDYVQIKTNEYSIMIPEWLQKGENDNFIFQNPEGANRMMVTLPENADKLELFSKEQGNRKIEFAFTYKTQIEAYQTNLKDFPMRGLEAGIKFYTNAMIKGIFMQGDYDFMYLENEDHLAIIKVSQVPTVEGREFWFCEFYKDENAMEYYTIYIAADAVYHEEIYKVLESFEFIDEEV